MPALFPSRLTLVLIALAGVYAVVALWPRGGAAGRVAVKGEVAVDGEPVPHGTVNFVPAASTKGPSASGRIRDGRFDLSAENGPGIGQYRLTIQIGDLLETRSLDSAASPSGLHAARYVESVTTHPGSVNTFQLNLSAAAAERPIAGQGRGDPASRRGSR